MRSFWGQTIPGVIVEQRVLQMAERAQETPVLPHVVFSILEPAGAAQPNADELDRMLCVDPGLSAKVLVLANSGSFGPLGEVRSLRQAVGLIGYRTIRTLAMTAGTFETFVGRTDASSLRRRRWWRNSLDTASACRLLAIQNGSLDPEEAYTTGLLYLLGRSMLDLYGGQDYGAVIELQLSGEMEWEAERQVYGCDHTELLVALACQWGLPWSLISGFDYLSEPAAEDESAVLRSCIAVGNRIALSARSGAKSDAVLAACPPWALDALGVYPRELQIAMDEGIGASKVLR